MYNVNKSILACLFKNKEGVDMSSIKLKNSVEKVILRSAFPAKMAIFLQCEYTRLCLKLSSL